VWIGSITVGVTLFSNSVITAVTSPAQASSGDAAAALSSEVLPEVDPPELLEPPPPQAARARTATRSSEMRVALRTAAHPN
jgi:hypothetical protein